MQVPGYLRMTTLGDVLGAIYREGATGALELTELTGPRSGSTHRIHVVSGLVVDVEASFPGTRLGDVLLQSGQLDPAKLRRCAAQVASLPGVRFGELLLRSRAVSEYSLSEALRVQRRERLERLFELDDARLMFHVARVRTSREALDPPQYLHGRQRQRDRARTARARELRAPSRPPLPPLERVLHVAPAVRRDPIRSRALETLGLEATADRSAVQRAFRELARSMHPDRYPDAGTTERAALMRRFAEITAAYHALVA